MTRQGQFGVVRTGGFVAQMIRLMTHSQVNHAYVYLDDRRILEAMPSGAVVSPASKYAGAVKAESRFPLTAEEAAHIAGVANGFIGTPYNFLDIVALFFLTLGFRWGWLLARAQRCDRLICSQLVDRVYTVAGLHLYNDNRPDGEVTPGNLLLLLAQKGDLL